MTPPTGAPSNVRPPWMGIELRHLMALSAVAQEGSFRDAAAELGYVPSAISQQVARLEKVVGARLIKRHRGGGGELTLTAEGELLLTHFKPIMAHFSAALADIDAIRDGRAGSVRVGVTESVATSLMPSILREITDRHPQLRVRVEEVRASEALAHRVASGELDLAFGALPLPEGPFEWIELCRDPYVLLTAADSALAAHGGMPSPAQLAGVGLGVGAALVPALAIDETDPRITALPLDGLVPERTLVLYWGRERRRAAARETFVEVARPVLAQRFER